MFIDLGTEFVLDMGLVAEFKHTPGEGVTSRLVPGEEHGSGCDKTDGNTEERARTASEQSFHLLRDGMSGLRRYLLSLKTSQAEMSD
jgi:hypothetical protein